MLLTLIERRTEEAVVVVERGGGAVEVEIRGKWKWNERWCGGVVAKRAVAPVVRRLGGAVGAVRREGRRV